MPISLTEILMKIIKIKSINYENNKADYKKKIFNYITNISNPCFILF